MAQPTLPPLEVNEHPLAQVYLRDEEQPDKQVWLTDRHIWVLRGSIQEKILLSEVNGITFEHRRPLFPLIGGGALLTFASLAVFQNSMPPYLLLAFFFGAFFLFYFGVNGRSVMNIKTGALSYDVPLHQVSDFHQRFVDFVIRVLQYTHGGRQWWLYLPEAPEAPQLTEGLDAPPEGWAWFPASNVEPTPDPGSGYLRVDVRQVQGEFQPTPGPEMGLRFVGHLPPQSILFLRQAQVAADNSGDSE